MVSLQPFDYHFDSNRLLCRSVIRITTDLHNRNAFLYGFGNGNGCDPARNVSDGIKLVDFHTKYFRRETEF